jgi:hypothetical protein
MADNFKINASIAYSDSEGSDVTAQLIDFVGSITTKAFHHDKYAVPTAEAAIKLGSLTAPFGWSLFKNYDDSNYFEIRSATGAANDVIKVPAGGVALFHFGSDISAPFWVANTAAVQAEYWIWAP